MSASAEIITTPTADTPGTTVVFRTPTNHYVFGSQAEGTQRALTQQGTRLIKAQDFFLTGRTEWNNIGGMLGLMLTLADAGSSSYEQAMHMMRQAKARGRKATEPSKPHFNIYGPPNLKHTLGTCRRFIFRKGLPFRATEYRDIAPQKDGNGHIEPSWQDHNIQVWALPIKPVQHRQGVSIDPELEARMQEFDTKLNTFNDYQAPMHETVQERDVRYGQIREATLKYMFDSNWNFDTLVERHLSEVEMPAGIFIRDPDTHGYKPYTGPKPGGSEPLPDIKVWTRTPWPGAIIPALPPTKPASESISYIVRAQPSRGAFDVARAKALGVKPGSDYGLLTSGKSVQNAAGETITPSQVLGPTRPGQGIAILDVPSVEYLEVITLREELASPEIMTGIGAMIWVLGPGVAGHPLLNEFIGKLKDVQHIISSTDVCPNRIANDSVAGQTTRLEQVDPSRYRVPFYDNSTIPQNSIFAREQNQAPGLPENAIIADRGMSFNIMPTFEFQMETKSKLFDSDPVKQETDNEVLRLAEAAREAVKNDQTALQSWKKLLARPDTEVTTLGTGSALPSKYRNVSATLVRVPGVGNYLFDCGENTLGQLSRAFPPEELEDIIKNLRVIWISHLHADHHLGIASVIRAWYQLVHNCVPNTELRTVSRLLERPQEYGLSVISHSGMLQWLSEYSSIEDFGHSRILPLCITPNGSEKGSELNLFNFSNGKIQLQHYEQLFGFVDIQAARVQHCFGAMAVSITFPRSPSDPEHVKPLKVSYSGDCRPCRHFAVIGKDTTVLIHEATFDDELLGDAKAKKHSTTSEALGIGAQMDAKATVLTHFSQRYQKIPVLQPVADDEPEDPLVDVKNTAEEADEEEDSMDVDPTVENTNSADIHLATNVSPSTNAPNLHTLQPQGSSTLHENERVVKVHTKEMKVAIAFDYMRVKIGEIAELEKFNEALNELLTKDKDQGVPAADGGEINANGKKTSGDEGGSRKKRQKQKSKRNN